MREALVDRKTGEVIVICDDGRFTPFEREYFDVVAMEDPTVETVGGIAVYPYAVVVDDEIVGQSKTYDVESKSMVEADVASIIEEFDRAKLAEAANADGKNS